MPYGISGGRVYAQTSSSPGPGPAALALIFGAEMPYGISAGHADCGSWACYIGGYASSVAAPRTDGEDECAGMSPYLRPASLAYLSEGCPEMPYGISGQRHTGLRTDQ